MTTKIRATKDTAAPETAPCTSDIRCLNDSILRIDLDEIEIETLDQRLELALAALFGDEPMDAKGQCGQFTCTGYWPD